MPLVQTTMQPGVWLEVSDGEYRYLEAAGLLYTGEGIEGVAEQTINIRTVQEPDEVITVTLSEYYDLLRQNLVYAVEGGDPIPRPHFTDAQYEEAEDPESVLSRRLGKMLGADGSTSFPDQLSATIAATAIAYFGPSFMTSAAVLQSTMDALSALGGGSLRLGRGVFNCLDDRVFIPGNVEIVGDGVSSTTLRVPDNTNPMQQINLEHDGVENTPTPRAGIRDLTIDGNKVGQAVTGGTTALVRAWVGDQFRMDNVIIKNGRANGMTLMGEDGVFTRPSHITNVEIHDCVGDGLVTSKRNRQIFLTNVYLHHNGGRGWWSDQSECHTVNVVAKWNGGIGIEFNNVQRHNHVGLVASFNGSHGIWFDQFITGYVQAQAMNNGQLAFNAADGSITPGLGYADIYVDNTDEQSYGINDRFRGEFLVGGDMNKVTEVPNASIDPHRTTEDYGLFIEDGVGLVTTTEGAVYDTNPGDAYTSPGIDIYVMSMDANVARVRLPDARGTLNVHGPDVDGWTDITLDSPYSAAAGFRPPQVRREGRKVKVRGAVSAPSGVVAGQRFAVLPEWARPSVQCRQNAAGTGGTASVCIVTTTAVGNFTPGTGGNTIVHLDGLEWDAAPY